MAEVEPQYASDYDDRTTVAVKSVLVEIGQILGSYRGKFVVIGGAVPWLLLGEADMPHIGTLDVDLSLDAEALGDGEYAQLVESLLRQGYHRREHLPRFQLVRTVSARDDGDDIDVRVDFLMPRDATIARNAPPLVANFAVQRADGADLALKFYQFVAIDGDMPDGGGNRVQIAVASIPALLAMKGYAIANRHKQKDAYDIYYSIRNFPDGIDALVAATRPLLDFDTARTGYLHISEKFRHLDDFGPTSVRQFVDRPDVLGERTADQWQQDAFGQVDAWLSALGLRCSVTAASSVKIRSMDMPIIDRVFGMEGGFVLDFSNRTFAEFFHDEFDVDIDNPCWAAQGGSKAKRLRYYLRQADRQTALDTLNALWEYRKASSVTADYNGLHAFGRGKSVVCMDGLDLHEVLSRRLDLVEIIGLKVRRAAETGVAFVPVRELNVPARG